MALPIVFIPGLMCTGRIYAQQALALGERHPVLLANHWSAPSMSEIAASILKQAPERFALVGTSMGGYVAFEMLRQAPERVANLVLMSTSARPDAPERSAQRRAQVDAARKSGVTDASAFWPILVHPARHEDAPLRAMFDEMGIALGVEAFARQIEAIIGRADSRPLLAEIKIPTLVIVGADDQLMQPENGREIAAGIAGARLETLAHCGHMPSVEKPESVTKLLAEFLA